MLSIVMVSGLVLGSIGSDVFASGQGKGSDEGKGKGDHGQEGCDNANAKSKACEKNPHTGNEECLVADEFADCDNDGIDNGVDFCPLVDVRPLVGTSTDWDGDSILNVDEDSESDKCDPA